MSIRSYLPAAGSPPPAAGAPERSGPRATILNLLVLSLLGRPWMALWFRLHPLARSPLAWAYHDEIAAAAPRDRWRRGLSFFTALPAAAAAQSDAESNDATRTAGDAPEPPPAQSASTDRLRLVRMFAALLVGSFFAVFAVITWIAVFGEIGDITDRRTPTSGGEIAALGLMLLIASAPVTLFLFRRRLTWRRPRDVEQSLAQSLGWVVVLIVFAVIAFGGWFGVTIENIDRLDLRTRHAFNDTLGLTMMALLAAAPLAALIWRRHWLPRAAQESAVDGPENA